MSSEDQPLSDAFYQNPLEYMQNHVRNLNNQIFLSEYHINSLYALLLIGRNSPWDPVKGSSPTIKEQIEQILSQRVYDVKIILENLSNMYEDKSKKSAISQIQKLMDILKSKKKAIFIEKDRNSSSFKRFEALTRIAETIEKKDKDEPQEIVDQKKEDNDLPQKVEVAKDEKDQEIVFIREYDQPEQQKQNRGENIQSKEEKHEQVIKMKDQSEKAPQVQTQPLREDSPQVKKQEQENINEEKEKQLSQQQKLICKYCAHHEEKDPSHKHQQKSQQSRQPSSGRQVFSLFYGLSNMSNLTAMALTNLVEHNSVERFIKFKMSQSYIMTIKSEDPFNFDMTSALKKLPSEMFVNHIFPYLTASQLFQVRSVCKQWLDHVKESWHATFKRQMFVQLLACQFCKDIQFYYKTIQLRNPFFQKLSLLIHALIEIINWQNANALINSNNIPLQLKRVLMILLRLMGQQVPFTNLASITDSFYAEHKGRLINLKEKISQFFSSLSGSDLSINDLRLIKTNFLDDPFMRVQDMNSDDKTPLLLNLLVKQITLQQILRNHIYLAQQYLLNTKRRLDNISKKMVYQKGYLQGVYKILLLKASEPLTSQNDSNQLPNFNDMLQSIFNNSSHEKPDFVIRGKNGSTSIYFDKATKLDIILSTVYNLNEPNSPERKQSLPQFEKREELTQEERQAKQIKNEIVNQVNLKVETSQQTQQEASECHLTEVKTEAKIDQNQGKQEQK